MIIQGLRQEITELKARLGQDSSNSSKPPSSDPPWKPPGDRSKPGERKRGGQPGHKKHERSRLEPDEIVPVIPGACVGCGDRLCGVDPCPDRHQVTELPEIVAHVTEYEIHTVRCQSCGVETTAAWPDGVPTGAFGPRLQAVVAVLTGAYRLSKRNAEEVLSDLFGAEISLGSVSNLEQATSAALAGPYEEAGKYVRAQSVIHADETGWYQKSKRAWLWTAVTARAAFFMIRKGRGTAAAKELLGPFGGVCVADQWRAYDWVGQAHRQLCWAHLIRHFRALADYGPEATELSEKLLAATEAVFDAWHRIRDGTMSRPKFVETIAPLERQMHELIERGRQSPIQRVKSVCRGLWRNERAMWTFVHVDGVEPTNNAAERALRHAVLWRKSSFGTDSEVGSRFVERILTVVTSLRMQKRRVLAYLTEACRASLAGRAAPALITA